MGWESWLNFRLLTNQSYGISFKMSRAGHYRKVDSSRRPHHHEYDIIYMGGRDINLSKFLPILSSKHDASLLKNYNIDCIWLQHFGRHAQNEFTKLSFFPKTLLLLLQFENKIFWDNIHNLLKATLRQFWHTFGTAMRRLQDNLLTISDHLI